jgi:Fic family protein
MYTLFSKVSYTISPTLLTNISYINNLRWQLKGMQISASKKKELEDTKIIEISHYSTKIEGNNISFPLSQSYLATQRDIPATTKDKRELLNTYNLIKSYRKKSFDVSTITSKHIHSFQKQITEWLLPESRIGQWREQQNVVRSWSLIVYMPPEAKDVELYMQELLQFIKHHHATIDPLLLSFIVHHATLLIHPYMDGNGRLSRFLQLLILWNKWFGDFKIYSVDTECELHLQEYYDAISIGSNWYMIEQVDGTKFLEWMSLMMVYALEKAVGKINSESPSSWA